MTERPQEDGRNRPTRRYRKTRSRRIGDSVMSVLVRAGLVPYTYLLTTRGRRTGLARTTPVTLVEQDGRRWLVAPYGPVSWVHNARAAGRVTLSRRRGRSEYTVREVSAAEAGPVLKRYVRVASATRPYFAAPKNSPVSAFVAEAAHHPVFELTPIPDVDLGKRPAGSAG
jgi:deazaflavin-dependent oxidoreductase (nitroreductase family)